MHFPLGTLRVDKDILFLNGWKALFALVHVQATYLLLLIKCQAQV